VNQNDPAFEFLDHIWPQDGHVLVHAKKGDAAPWQKIFQNIGDALAWLRQLDAQGFNCYHHIGSVRDPQGVWDPKKNNGKGGYKKRGRGNVHRLKVLVADIDTNELGTKPNAPYKNRAEALAAVEAFCQAARIPPPTIVSSGTGLHCYWVLIEELDFETWQPLADSFKAACFHYGLKIDPPRSADATSVLRTPTMRHQSSGRIVEVITELTRPYPVSAFAHLLEQLPSKRRQAKSSKLASTEQTSSGPQILDALRNVEPPPSDILYEREKLWSLLNHVGTDGQRTFDPDWSYPEWCEGVLMAIASTGWPCALDIAIWWSAQAKTEGKYPGPEAIRAKMTSFTRERGPNTTTERSLYKRALDRGWKEPPPSHEAQLELAERATRNTIETALQEDAPKTPDTRNAYFENRSRQRKAIGRPLRR